MTTYSSGNIDSTKILAQAILNVTQDISQGSIVQQHIDIDCSNKSSCNSCLTTAKQYKLDEGGDYSGICRMCYCNLENIDMKNMSMKLQASPLPPTVQPVYWTGAGWPDVEIRRSSIFA